MAGVTEFPSQNNIAASLAESGVFAVLIAVPLSGEVICRPIGGSWDSSITDAICELNELYPQCKMKLLEQDYSAWRRYFEGIVTREQLLL